MSTSWLDLTAAKKRLAQLDGEMQQLGVERNLIETVLKTVEDETRPPSARPSPVLRVRASRVLAPPPRVSHPSQVSLVDLIADALRFAPSDGLTIAEIVRHISRNHPDRASAPGANLLVGAAAAQASRAKKPRIRVVQKAATGIPVRFGAA